LVAEAHIAMLQVLQFQKRSMAGYRGHISIAFLFGVVLVIGLSFTSVAMAMEWPERIINALVILWIAVLFGLFPDVDIKSKGQLLFYWLFFLLDGILLLTEHYQEAAFLGFLAMIPILSKHRGWTHTFWAMLLVPAPILVGPMYFAGEPVTDGLPYYLGAIVGYFSHLVADGMVIKRKRRR
jgi:membrane-bound metal-dependent hydrolase YbcI (DUF457 family)